MTKNWRTPVDAGDYFLQEKKKVAIEERRPVIRRASDLVGPGIAPSAVRVTDWSDTLATFNGYYASLPGAVSAPNGDEAFLGYTVMDAEVGGTQMVTGMTSGAEYKRIFRRNPADPEFITWGLWDRARDRTAATIESSGPVPTTVRNGISENLFMPSTEQIGTASVFAVAGTRLNVLRPGVYTGYLIVSDGVVLSSLEIKHPSLSGMVVDTRGAIAAFGHKWFPLTFATTTTDQYIEVTVRHDNGDDEIISITSLALTRTSQI